MGLSLRQRGVYETRGDSNQLALEAAIMELSLKMEQQGFEEAGRNARGALETIGENAGHIRQGIARLRAADDA
ncbi:hypothetical protein [Pseudomonas costantinii]|uniref:hypothetical protein n=1 Tax=Pseudomonas costantinii TaxID=168469 RepID=UPI0034E953AF